jgi:hypothetical protein
LPRFCVRGKAFIEPLPSSGSVRHNIVARIAVAMQRSPEGTCVARQLRAKQVPAAKSKHATIKYCWTITMETEFSVVRAEMI